MNFRLPSRFLGRTVNVTIVGAGGTGSQMADQLASLEVTLRRLGHPGFRVTVIDPDHVSDSNIGRQRFTAADIGAPKATVLVHRINAFYGLSWTARVDHFIGADVERWDMPDLLITCVDKALVRAEIGQAFAGYEHEGLWCDMGNGPVSGNVVLGHLGEPDSDTEIRLPNVYDLYPELAQMSEQDDEAPSCSTEEAISRQEWPVNRLAAMIASELLWTLFRHGSIQTHGAFFTLGSLQVTPLPIDPVQWSFMGYECQRMLQEEGESE